VKNDFGTAGFFSFFFYTALFFFSTTFFSAFLAFLSIDLFYIGLGIDFPLVFLGEGTLGV
jgi:hypothetical protein